MGARREHAEDDLLFRHCLAADDRVHLPTRAQKLMPVSLFCHICPSPAAGSSALLQLRCRGCGRRIAVDSSSMTVQLSET